MQRRVFLQISTQTCNHEWHSSYYRFTGDTFFVRVALYPRRPFARPEDRLLLRPPPRVHSLGPGPPLPYKRTPSSGSPPTAPRWVSVCTFFNSYFLLELFWVSAWSNTNRCSVLIGDKVLPLVFFYCVFGPCFDQFHGEITFVTS